MPIHYQANANYAQHGAQRTLADLVALGVTIPDPVQAAADHLEHLTTRRKALPSEADRRTVALDALRADPASDITDMVLGEITWATTSNVLLQAIDQARGTLAHAITSHSDELTRHLTAALFAPALATLTTVATKAGPHDTMATLVRAGNTKAARALADAPAAAEDVIAAYRLRAAIYRGSDLERQSCTRWENPDDIDPVALREVTGLDYFLAGLRQGGRLWLGTYAEVHDASRTHDAERQAKTQADIAQYAARAKQRRQRSPEPLDAA